MKRDHSDIQKEVKKRGFEIFCSDIFQQIKDQKHHNVTVGTHCIGVAEDCVRIADSLERIGLHADRDVLVRASLCHDLGMLNRDQMYRSDFESWRKHPKVSLKNARQAVSYLSEKEKDCIRHHMWPFLLSPPRTLEGFIVCFADKKSSFREVFRKKGKTLAREYEGWITAIRDDVHLR